MTRSAEPRVLQFCHGYDGPFLDCARQYASPFAGTPYKVTTVFLTGRSDPEVAARCASDEVLFLEYGSRDIRGLAEGDPRLARDRPFARLPLLHRAPLQADLDRQPGHSSADRCERLSAGNCACPTRSLGGRQRWPPASGQGPGYSAARLRRRAAAAQNSLLAIPAGGRLLTGLQLGTACCSSARSKRHFKAFDAFAPEFRPRAVRHGPAGGHGRRRTADRHRLRRHPRSGGGSASLPAGRRDGLGRGPRLHLAALDRRQRGGLCAAHARAPGDTPDAAKWWRVGILFPLGDETALAEGLTTWRRSTAASARPVRGSCSSAWRHFSDAAVRREFWRLPTIASLRSLHAEQVARLPRTRLARSGCADLRPGLAAFRRQRRDPPAGGRATRRNGRNPGALPGLGERWRTGCGDPDLGPPPGVVRTCSSGAARRACTTWATPN